MAKSIGIRERAPRFQPVDLAGVPHVNALLSRLNLGTFDPHTVTSPRGRNDNWAGTTENGAHVFVKQFGTATDTTRSARMHRTQLVWEAGRDRLATPEVLGCDVDNGLVAFAYLEDAENGAELLADDAFDETLAEQAGALVARLHGLDPTGFDTDEHPLPPLGLLAALPLQRYANASFAELEMWRLLHADTALIEALHTLRAADRAGTAAARCPVHGDLRVDQFLRAGDRLFLTDFEETRLGDPARDVGAFAGEWLYQAATRIPGALAEASPVGHTVTHEEIVSTGAVEVERCAPLVRAFYRAYLAAAPEAVRADTALASRAAAYAGWHMLDRMLAAAQSSARLSPINKAAAGIGRTVLLSPAEFTTTLGLEA
ncbi:class V lanthionine synthetase subunit LxmK [Actinacidiphila sp. bgisy167]|uniref:class V lanthionine synthetase subunit LxmK n=1 Tax=Actinacidiphila sp. bgisy167 TaxID=3413797 RepID=UPI003D711AEF